MAVNIIYHSVQIKITTIQYFSTCECYFTSGYMPSNICKILSDVLLSIIIIIIIIKQ